MLSQFRIILPLPSVVGEESFLWGLLPLIFEKGIFVPAANQSLNTIQ